MEGDRGPFEDPRGFSFGKVFSRCFGTLLAHKPLTFDLSSVGSVHLLRVALGIGKVAASLMVKCLIRLSS